MQTQSVQTSPPNDIDADSRFLRFDETDMRERFDREPFALEHEFCGHPLLELPRLIELARALPEQNVEYNSGDLPIGQDPALTPRNGLSITDTLQQIENCRSWMVLKYIEHDPDYKRLLETCLDQIRPLVERTAPGICRSHAFVFVSSPGATTPYHVDFEHNFLLHLRGEKTITVWDGNDRSVMSEVERERKVTGASRNLPYRDEFAAKGKAFRLRPGMGVQVPLSSPHWVKVGDQVAISLSITFLTKRGARLRALHTANAFLRRHGISPRNVDVSATGDFFKYTGYRAYERLRQGWTRLRNAEEAT